MAFSFNPGQSAQASDAGGIAPNVASQSQVQDGGLPSIPDSPFLYLQQRGKDKSVTAYLQIVLLLIAIITVIAAIILAIYSFYLRSSRESKISQLADSELTFKDYPLAEMKPLSDRFAALSSLLQGYVSIRSPLKLLEDVVEKQVVFNQFSITHEKSGGYTAQFVVVTSDYQSLIQQLEALQLTQYKKIAPDTKYDNFKQDKNQILRVQVTTPVFVQGVLPDEIVFVESGSSTPQTQTGTQATSSVSTQATTTSP